MSEYLDLRHPTRRQMIALGVGAFAVAVTPLARRRRPQIFKRTLPLMGTLAEIDVVHEDGRFASLATDAAFDELRRVEAHMTRFTETSDVGRLNRASGRAAAIHNDTYVVLSEALEWAERTDGRFDPCLGLAAETWDVVNRTEPPPPKTYQRLADKRLYRALEVTRTPVGSVAQLTDTDARLDLGAIAKGYGVDRASAVLRDWGVTAALVNVGGDLYAIGRSADGDAWRIGVRSPTRPETLLGHTKIEDEAIATSGDYLRYFRYDGRRYHHLIDPQTGAPWEAPETRSTTIAAPTCMQADAAATALFGLSESEASGRLAAWAPDARLIRQV